MLQIAVHKYSLNLSGRMFLSQRANNMLQSFMNNFLNYHKKILIVEPEMRDRWSSRWLVVAQMAKMNPDEPLTLLWGSDHLVKKEALFRKILRIAENRF